MRPADHLDACRASEARAARADARTDGPRPDADCGVRPDRGYCRGGLSAGATRSGLAGRRGFAGQRPATPRQNQPPPAGTPRPGPRPGGASTPGPRPRSSLRVAPGPGHGARPGLDLRGGSAGCRGASRRARVVQARGGDLCGLSEAPRGPAFP